MATPKITLLIAPFFVLATIKTAKNGHQHIKDRRIGTRFQFWGELGNGGYLKIDKSCMNTEHHHDQQVDQRSAQRFHIIDRHRKTNTHNRAHQRRNMHGADYHRSAAHVKADGRHKY